MPKSDKAVAKTNAKKNTVRPVYYPVPDARFYLADDPITADLAKELLGWEELDKDADPSEAICKDMYGNLIRCNNNYHNRPFTYEWACELAQDVLNRKWADSRNGSYYSAPVVQEDGLSLEEEELPELTLNGETIIIGRTKLVLSAQHRLFGVIFAKQLWDGAKFRGVDQSAHWKELWPEEPSIEGLIVYGVSEDPRVVRTLDNTRPRTIGDVFYSDEMMFKLGKNTRPSDRLRMTKVLENAVRFLRSRMGGALDSYHKYLTRSEAVDFIQRHKKLCECVAHVYKEDAGIIERKEGEAPEQKKRSAGRISGKYIPLGAAAALMYLMATSGSDGDLYRHEERGGDGPGEKNLDFGYWDQARDFWSELARRSSDLKAISDVKRPREGDTGNTGWSGYVFVKGRDGGSLYERAGVLVKAWSFFRENKKPRPAELKLKYDIDHNDDESVASVALDDFPSCGGIDRAGQSSDPDGGPGRPTADASDTDEAPEFEEGAGDELSDGEEALEGGDEDEEGEDEINVDESDAVNGSLPKPKYEKGAPRPAPGEVRGTKPTEYDKDGKPLPMTVPLPKPRKKGGEDEAPAAEAQPSGKEAPKGKVKGRKKPTK